MSSRDTEYALKGELSRSLRDDVRRSHPSNLILRLRKRALHVRQRDVCNCGVESLYDVAAMMEKVGPCGDWEEGSRCPFKDLLECL
jgi:hypothetical protein